MSCASSTGVGSGDSTEYRELLRREQNRYSGTVVPVISVLAGVAGGFFAVPAVILNEIANMFSAVSFLSAGAFVLVVLGPFAEETLKQSGAIFQMEKMRGSIRYGWQFFLSGMLGGLVFSVLENLIYQYIYLRNLTPEKLAAAMAFRWTICTSLHMLCPPDLRRVPVVRRGDVHPRALQRDHAPAGPVRREISTSRRSARRGHNTDRGRPAVFLTCFLVNYSNSLLRHA